MAIFSHSHITLAGLSAAVPGHRASNAELDLLPEKERARFIKTTGIETRRVAPPGMTAADLCFVAAEKLLTDLGWAPDTIDVLIFVTQTPDFTIPGTATQLQQWLGLSQQCMALDINQGCAGYVYGLSTVSALMAAGQLKRGLLLVGDTITHTLSPGDKSTVPIFSDAGSATALSYSPEAAPMTFHLQSDGARHAAIIVPEGGSRHPLDEHSALRREVAPGIQRAGCHLAMQGLDIFNFALREVAPNIRALLQKAGESVDSIDHFVFHQANLLLNESIRKKLQIPKEKVPYSLPEFGNTSCATVPVTLVARLRKRLESGPANLILSGFGVGLSWGSVHLRTPALCCPEMIEL